MTFGLILLLTIVGLGIAMAGIVELYTARQLRRTEREVEHYDAI
jgi:hypothetical protein